MYIMDDWLFILFFRQKGGRKPAEDLQKRECEKV